MRCFFLLVTYFYASSILIGGPTITVRIDVIMQEFSLFDRGSAALQWRILLVYVIERDHCNVGDGSEHNAIECGLA
jgi:hypothetical protein